MRISRATGALVAETESADEGEAEEAAVTRKVVTIGEDCPVYVSRRPIVLLLTPNSCYEEMTEKDEQKKLLVYDDAVGGCGKGRICYTNRC